MNWIRDNILKVVFLLLFWIIVLLTDFLNTGWDNISIVLNISKFGLLTSRFTIELLRNPFLTPLLNNLIPNFFFSFIGWFSISFTLKLLKFFSELSIWIFGKSVLSSIKPPFFLSILWEFFLCKVICFFTCLV